MKKFTYLLTAITVSFPLMSVSQIRQGKTNRSILNIKNRSLFRYFLLSIIFVLMSANVAWGQPWTYDFGTGTGTFTSTTASTTFLPTPSSGTARVRCGTNPGTFTLANPGQTIGTATELEFRANTSSTSTSKFSVYGYTASKVGYLKTSISINGGTNGVYQLWIGSGTTYSDNNSITAAQTFAGIQWTLGTSNAITYRVLNAATWGTTGITNSTTLFSQSTSNIYNIEIYYNNTTSSTNYVRSGTTYSLSNATWDLWVNGTKQNATNLAKGNFGTDTNINSFAFNHQVSASAPGTIYIDDLEYSNALPAGSVLPEPTNQVTNFAAGTVTTSAIPLTWTAAATGSQAPDGYLVKLNTGTVVDPVDGTDPADVTAIASGAANVKVTPSSATSAATFTGMSAGTMYNYKIYSYTNSGANINFKTNSVPSINHATLPNVVTLPSLSATGTTTANITWTAASGHNNTNHSTLVFVKQGSAVTVGTPTNAPSTYTANSDFTGAGTAYQGDASAKCVYKGDGTNISITGLTANTAYYVLILNVVDASNSNSTNSYSASATVNGTTLKNAPTTQASAITFSAVGSTTMTVNWTVGNGDGRIVLMNTSNSFTDPVDGTPQTAGSGQCVYSGTGNSVAVTGLTASTTYWFRVYEYNNSSTNTKYYTATATNNPNSQATNAGPIIAWQLYGKAGNEASVNATTQNSNLNTSTLSRGAGLNASSLADVFSSTNYTASGVKSDAITNNKYVYFTVNAKTGYTVSLSTLDVKFRRSNTGPNAFRWQYSTDGTTFTDIGSSDISYTATTSGGDSQTQIDLSGISALQNVSDGITITIRLLGWGATNTGGTFAIGKSTITTEDYGLAIGGTIGTSSATATPTFSPVEGTYNSTQSVTLSSTTPGAKIYYTTDSSTPTSGSTLYSGAISVAATTTIKAIAYDSGNSNPSSVSSATYTIITTPTTQASNIAFPTVGSGSLGVNWTVGNGTGRVVVMNTSNSFTAPTDGSSPSASTTYSGSGQQVVYNGTGGTPISITGLSALTTYWFRVYEFNGSGTNTKYNTSTSTNNPNSQQTSCGTSETFTNINSTSSYATRTWNGDDGSIWTATEAREDQTLNGKAICFSNTGTRKLTSSEYTSGIGTLSFKYVRAFTNTDTRTLKVYINGSQIGSDISVSTSSDTYVTYSNAINITGSIVLEIHSTGAGQVKIDDISFDCPVSVPTISVSPTSVTGLDYVYNEGPSASQLIVVTGNNLTSNISITPPTNYQISTDGTTYSSGSLTLGTSGGNVYVRLAAGLSMGTYNGSVSFASTDATTKTLLVSGSVTYANIAINDIKNDSTWNMLLPTSGTLKVYQKTTGGGGFADELFFSKYLEGQSNNKLLEIFNGTSNSVSLDGVYKVQVFQVGSTPHKINWDSTCVKTYDLTGTLLSGETKVIYTRATTGTVCDASLFDAGWQSFAEGTNAVQFNGNDAIRLIKINTDTTEIDIIGQTRGYYPVARWGTNPFSTERSFLIRNNTVVSGYNAIDKDTTSFVTLTDEWTLAKDIDEGTSGSTTCDAVSLFGSYDYNANYSNWADITSVSSYNVVDQGQVQVTLNKAGTRPCEELKAEVLDGSNNILTSNTFRVPIMVSANNATVAGISTSLTPEVCEDCDVAVLNGGILTAATEGKKFKDAFVLAGGKLDVPSKLEVNDLILKAGYSGDLYSSFPSSSMRVGATNGIVVNGTFGYVREINDAQWYFVSFPYDVKLTDIYALNASLGTYNTDWYIKYWDGQSRAINRNTTGNWKVFAYDVNAILTANKGYIIGLKTGATPKQIVFPMLSNSTIPIDANKTISVTAYVKGDATTDAYSDGWNLIGLPFLSKFNGGGLPAGTKILLSDGGTTKTYTVKYASDFNGTNLLNPFISYYIQAGDALAGTGVVFNTTSRSLAPSKTLKESEFDNVRIFYTSSTGEDYMNLELDETQNVGYEIGRDLVKWFGTGTLKPQMYMTQGGYNLAVDAVNYPNAQNIPVTVYNKIAGSVTFSADATSATGLLSLILSDNVTGANTNLLTSNYTYTADAGTVSNRFTLSAQRIITAEKPLLESDIRITSNHGVIHIDNIPTNCKVEVFDTVGRMITYSNLNINTVEFRSISKGVYIIQIITEGKRNSYKIIL